MKRDRAVIERNARPAGFRVQHRVTAKHGVIIDNPGHSTASSHYFVQWDDGSITPESPRHLAAEFFL